MADVLAVRDEYRAQNWAMVIQECNSSGLSNRKLRSHMAEVAAPQLVQLETAPTLVQEDVLQIRYRGAELKLPSRVDMDAVSALLRSLQTL